MKKLVLAALLSTFAFGAAAAEKISFGVSATYPPFESMDANNQIAGFDIDLANALCKQMQAECTFTNHAFDSLIPALKFKKYDCGHLRHGHYPGAQQAGGIYRPVLR